MGAVSFCGALAEQKIERTAGIGIPNTPEPFAPKNPKNKLLNTVNLPSEIEHCLLITEHYLLSPKEQYRTKRFHYNIHIEKQTAVFDIV